MDHNLNVVGLNPHHELLKADTSSPEVPVTGSSKHRSTPEMPSSSVDHHHHSHHRTRTTSDSKEVCKCQICNDIASGFHYGVWSCEGCKAFFKRSLHGPVDYICPATNSCTIDKLRRKSCQACRLRKCHEAGMSAGPARKDKGFGSAGKKRKASEDDQSLSDTETTPTSNFGKVARHASNIGSSREISPSGIPHGTASPGTAKLSSSGTDSPPVSAFQGRKLVLVEQLLNIEPPSPMAEFDDLISDSRLQLLSGLLKLINCQLVDIINWSKALPYFSESSLESRTQLLVMCWSELLVLGTVWNSLPHTDTWVCAPNLHLTREHCKVAAIDQLFVRILSMIRIFRHLQLTRRELVLLRLTILLNSDVACVENQNSLNQLRCLLEETWLQVTAENGKSPRNRMSRLLLTLPDIRHCSLMMLEVINSVRRENGVPVYDLLQEMMDCDFDHESTADDKRMTAGSAIK